MSNHDHLEMVMDLAKTMNKAMSERNVYGINTKNKRRNRNLTNSIYESNSVSDEESEPVEMHEVNESKEKSLSGYNYSNELRKRQTIDFIVPYNSLQRDEINNFNGERLNSHTSVSPRKFMTSKKILFEKPESDAPDLAVDIDTVNGLTLVRKVSQQQKNKLVRDRLRKFLI